MDMTSENIKIKNIMQKYLRIKYFPFLRYVEFDCPEKISCVFTENTVSYYFRVAGWKNCCVENNVKCIRRNGNYKKKPTHTDHCSYNVDK